MFSVLTSVKPLAPKVSPSHWIKLTVSAGGSCIFFSDLYSCPLVSAYVKAPFHSPGLISLPHAALASWWFLLKPPLQSLPELGAPSGPGAGRVLMQQSTALLGLTHLLLWSLSSQDHSPLFLLCPPFLMQMPLISSRWSFVISLLLFFPPR